MPVATVSRCVRAPMAPITVNRSNSLLSGPRIGGSSWGRYGWSAEGAIGTTTCSPSQTLVKPSSSAARASATVSVAPWSYSETPMSGRPGAAHDR